MAVWVPGKKRFGSRFGLRPGGLGPAAFLGTGGAFPDLLESRTFVHGLVIGLVALDQILRLLLRGVDRVPLERDFRNDFLLDRPPDSTCFRVPLDMIPHLEVVCHWYDLLSLPLPLSDLVYCPSIQLPRTAD